MITRIDWHSHILPKLDDGSSSIEESLAMLQRLYAGGVKRVALTPHFYPDTDDPETFLASREKSYELLRGSLGEHIPLLMLGAEVAYFDGIRVCDQMKGLVIEGTNCLLIELPMSHWTNRMFANILTLRDRIDLVPLLAHIDRYHLGHREWDMVSHYIDNGGLVQANAEMFLSPWKRQKAIRMLENGMIHVIGSDCHNMTKRPPLIGNAFDYIETRGDQLAIEKLNKTMNGILN